MDKYCYIFSTRERDNKLTNIINSILAESNQIKAYQGTETFNSHFREMYGSKLYIDSVGALIMNRVFKSKQLFSKH